MTLKFYLFEMVASAQNPPKIYSKFYVMEEFIEKYFNWQIAKNIVFDGRERCSYKFYTVISFPCFDSFIDQLTNTIYASTHDRSDFH